MLHAQIFASKLPGSSLSLPVVTTIKLAQPMAASIVRSSLRALSGRTIPGVSLSTARVIRPQIIIPRSLNVIRPFSIGSRPVFSSGSSK